MDGIVKLTRREFLRLTGIAGSGLLLGIMLPDPLRARIPEPAERPFVPDVFVQIAPDDTVTIVVAKSEMGQGVRTALPMIVAEELDADWSRIRIIQADAAADNRYGRQGTGGSTSVRTSWERLRRAGAVARTMLVTAAARKWGVDPATCRTESGWVVHPPTGRRARYGELVEQAARLPVPDPKTVPLKDNRAFRLLGRSPRRVDVHAIVNGRATYGIDVRISGMKFATVVQSPVFGRRIRRVDTSAAKKVAGVRQIVRLHRMEEPERLEDGVAVVADTTWAAMQGAKALRIEWEPEDGDPEHSDRIRQRLQAALDRPAEVIRSDGNVDRALQQASRTVEAVYAVPFLAHATMEPMNCTVHVREDSCEIWAPTQNPQRLQRSVAKVLGLPPEAVTVHVTLLGGGFGRRLFQEFAVQAALVSKAVKAPVQVVWTREEDMRHDYYRPCALHRLQAGLDEKGRLTAWLHRIASTGRDGVVRHGFPVGIVPNYRLEYAVVPTPVPWGWWRAVVYTHHTFAVQCFIDELAAAVGQDAVTFRLTLLRKAPEDLPYDARRLARVIERAADMAGWGRRREGRALGVAAEYCFGSYIAQVAEVSVDNDRVRVHRVWVAVDPGVVVHPDMIRAQMESGIVYGLTAALHGEITIEDGRVRQSNFHDYPLLRIDEMPAVAVAIIADADRPGGIGEVGVPCIAPAVANALAVLTGKRVRALPIRWSTVTANPA